jgi:hypothetical protein
VRSTLKVKAGFGFMGKLGLRIWNHIV